MICPKEDKVVQTSFTIQALVSIFQPLSISFARLDPTQNNGWDALQEPVYAVPAGRSNQTNNEPEVVRDLLAE